MTRIPHLRARYIKRATYLLRVPQFWSMLEGARQEWARAHPEYPSSPPRSTTDNGGIGAFAFPTGLQSKLSHMEGGLLPDDLALTVYFARLDWESHCRDVSGWCFDRRAFPEFDIKLNPGAIFISHCLVFDLHDVRPDAFFSQTIQPRVQKNLMTWDVRSMGLRAENTFLRSEIKRLLGDDTEKAESLFCEADSRFLNAANEASIRRDNAELGDVGTELVLPIPIPATKTEVLEAAASAWTIGQQSNKSSLDSAIREIYRAVTTPVSDKNRRLWGEGAPRTYNEVCKVVADYVGVEAAYVRNLTEADRFVAPRSKRNK